MSKRPSEQVRLLRILIAWENWAQNKTYQPGEIITATASVADALVRAGYAERLTPAPEAQR